MSVSVATIYVNNEKVLKIIDTSSNPQIASVQINANENTIRATFIGVNGSTSGFSCVLDCEIYNTSYTYTKISDFELVITSPVKLDAFEKIATIGNNSTINLVYNPYNITTSKPKIVIHCEGKSMADNLVITNEVYMGEFEEIEGLPTLTLDSSNFNTNYVDLYYSIDSGNTYTSVSSFPVTIENVSKIKFKVTTTTEVAFYIGTTDGDNDIVSMYPDTETIETEEIEISNDTTLYFTCYVV